MFDSRVVAPVSEVAADDRADRDEGRLVSWEEADERSEVAPPTEVMRDAMLLGFAASLSRKLPRVCMEVAHIATAALLQSTAAAEQQTLHPACSYPGRRQTRTYLQLVAEFIGLDI
jgi:hypothetical protein